MLNHHHVLSFASTAILLKQGKQNFSGEIVMYLFGKNLESGIFLKIQPL